MPIIWLRPMRIPPFTVTRVGMSTTLRFFGIFARLLKVEHYSKARLYRLYRLY